MKKKIGIYKGASYKILSHLLWASLALWLQNNTCGERNEHSMLKEKKEKKEKEKGYKVTFSSDDIES